MGVDVEYDAHGQLPSVDIYLIPDPTAVRDFIASYPVGRPTTTLTVRADLHAQEYAGFSTVAVALSWRDRNYTVLLTGTSEISNAQLQTIANHLTITSS